MDDSCRDVARSYISSTYVDQGLEALRARRKLVKGILSQRRLPEQGLDEASLEGLMQDLAAMDSNNFLNNVGVGEREARVACPLVARRHFRLAHGIGRSGDVAAEQPKAAGSSLLAKLANALALDALRIAGLADVGAVTVLPLATGMALTLALLALRQRRPPGARYVLWPRIDQKTCLKCVAAAGLEAVPLEPLGGPLGDGDQLVTDLAGIEAALERLGPDNVVCVLSTTSCFAPRAADDVAGIAALCRRAGVGHLINNAYGVQSRQLCQQVTRAWRRGRVDAVVQSTDKNFLVPVGGAVIAAGAGDPSLVDACNKLYPGRAALTPLGDLLLTLLHWGAAGWRRVLEQREALFGHLHARLSSAAAELGERVLATPGNPISLAMTLDGLHRLPDEEGQGAERGPPGGPEVTLLGAMLFRRCVSGLRVVARGKQQTVAGRAFSGYGAHCSSYPHDYLTVAAAIGTRPEDVDAFIPRLLECYAEFKRRHRRVPELLDPT